jgi:hypothetical protein
MDETVTSCTGSKEHTHQIEQLPSADSPGIVLIGESYYFCRPTGGNRWKVSAFKSNTERGGRVYQVSAGDGRHSCTCGDSVYRSQGGKLRCKHVQSDGIQEDAMKESQP